jgi:hypothetical protein
MQNTFKQGETMVLTAELENPSSMAAEPLEVELLQMLTFNFQYQVVLQS